MEKKAQDVDVFVFSEANLKIAASFVARYPEGRQASAVLALLDLAQRQCGGWLPRAAMRTVAAYLEMPEIRVYEVATFYSMFNLKPVGKNFIQVCTTTPCWLRGSQDLMDHCHRKLGLKKGDTSADGQFTLTEVECLGACVNAPIVQINDDFFEDLTVAAFDTILDDLAAGREPRPGSAIGRQGSSPVAPAKPVKKG